MDNNRFKTQEIQKIQIARRQLGLADDIYRDIIREASGGKTESSTKLNWQGRRAVLDRMKELGFVAKPTKAPTRRLADDPQSKMLRGRWIELHKAGIVRNPSETALCAMVKRITGKDALQWLNDKDVTAVNEALKKMAERA